MQSKIIPHHFLGQNKDYLIICGDSFTTEGKSVTYVRKLCNTVHNAETVNG